MSVMCVILECKLLFMALYTPQISRNIREHDPVTSKAAMALTGNL